MLSVEAFQARSTDVAPLAGERRLPGTEGASVSGGPGCVEPMTLLDACETLFAASFAKTVQS